jgi:two-component system alkaline phosphatase synthesis response regulator PhoP
MNLRILLVEDEPGLVLTLTDLLAAEGYDVFSESNGNVGLSRALSERFDLILLDVMLPGRNGFEICAELRANACDTAILMLTARGLVTDKVEGLKRGADDYLAKPFDPAELLARVEALLRRVKKEKRPNVLRFQFGDIEVDFVSGEARRRGEMLALAGKELQLLHYLIEHRGDTVPREELLQSVWEYQSDVSSRTVDVHIAWLRQKVEDNVANPRYIQTVRGVGYRFMP